MRIEPKLRFGLELAAAKERRSLSSMIEWAIDRTLRTIVVATDAAGKKKSALEVADEVWDDNEIRRLLFLSASYPELLTTEQQSLRNRIVHSQSWELSEAASGTSLSMPELLRKIDWKQLQNDWHTIKKIAAGELPEEALPIGNQTPEAAPGARRRLNRKKKP